MTYPLKYSCATITAQEYYKVKKVKNMYREYLNGRIGSLIYITGTLVRGLSSQTFAEQGYELTPDQYVILSLLLDNDEIKYQRQIAEIIFKDRANVARIIDILKEKGFIEKIPDSNGRKIYKLIVTKEGKEARDKILPTAKEIRKMITNNISEEELNVMFSTLEKMNINIRDKVKLQI